MPKSIEERILALKSDRNAVILAHNYQRPEVQDIADYTGDSLGLSRQAAATEAEVIVFCGVHFMAETAAILSPQKTVLLPDIHAGCPMADMINADQLRDMKSNYPDAVVVCYVNSSAEVKAECDYCCTSANATAIIESIPSNRDIIFVPDKFLGRYTAEVTGRNMIFWQGYCPTHACIDPRDIIALKEKHPQAKVIVHPECPGRVVALADAVLSTSGMCGFARDDDAQEFIVATEMGMLHRLKNDNPGKRFYPATANAVCPNMKTITLEDLLWSLEDMQHVVTVDPKVAAKARRAIDRMVSTVE